MLLYGIAAPTCVGNLALGACEPQAVTVHRYKPLFVYVCVRARARVRAGPCVRAVISSFYSHGSLTVCGYGFVKGLMKPYIGREVHQH